MDESRKFDFCFLLVILLLGFALPTSALADDSSGKKGLRDKGDSSSAIAAMAGEVVSVSSAENDPRAIVKEGFLGKVESTSVSLINMETHRESTYRLEEQYKVFYQNEDYLGLYGAGEISLDVIPPSSIVKFILIEGQIREIILLQRSS